MTRQVPGGRRYTFFANQWLRFDTTKIPGHEQDIAYFKSDDLYKVVEGFHPNSVLENQPESEVMESVEVEEPKKMKARK